MSSCVGLHDYTNCGFYVIHLSSLHAVDSTSRGNKDSKGALQNMSGFGETIRLSGQSTIAHYDLYYVLGGWLTHRLTALGLKNESDSISVHPCSAHINYTTGSASYSPSEMDMQVL